MVRRTKQEAQETRSRILDAAERVFHEKGVAHAGLEDIASAAKVTRGAIYWHFKNKVDLFDAMIERVLDPVEAKVAQLQAQEGDDPLESLRALVLFFLDKVASDERIYRVVETAWHKCEYVGEMAQVRDLHLECGNRYLGIYEAALRTAQQRGHLPPSLDARQAAVGLMALVDGLTVNWTLDRESFPLARLAPGIVDAYLAGLRAAEQAAAPL
jgi:TetR/AcrR family transcriptional regulator, acrAB operon repressor